MFKSIQESVRSLLSVSTNDKKHSSGIKRKRSYCDGPGDEDPDVQIIKVEKKRKIDTHSPFWSIFNLPSKMGDWVRLKSKIFSEQFAPVSRDRGRKNDSKDSLSKRNGVFPRAVHESRSKERDNLVPQRAPFVTDRKGHGVFIGGNTTNYVNASRLNGEHQLSSTSSWSRPSHNYSSSMQCIRLKEREEYHKLIKMQSKLSSSPSRMSAFSRDADVLSVASSSSGELSILGTSNCLSQSRQFSNTSIPTTQYKPVPSKTFTPSQESNDRFLQKYRVTDFRSIGPLVSRQRRRAGFESPTSDTKSKSAESRRCTTESRTSSHSKESVIIIEDEEDDNRGRKAVDITSPSDDNIVKNGISSKSQQNESLDFRESAFLQENYLEKLKNSRLMHCEQWRRQVEDEQMKAKAYEAKRRAQGIELERKLKHQMRIFEEEPEVSEEILIEEEEDKKDVLPELTENMMEIVHSALRPGPPGEVLSEAFRLQITRKDMGTLAGLNWLNDEIINFYMNMLIERGEHEGMSKVYAFNTFFYPKIMSGGHSAVKRWTKKVDIFAMHYILIPVHLGMHWCLCVADMKEKEITYYDSMGGRNNDCLQAALKYINDESVAKKQKPINTSEWKLQIAQDNPQQLNGSDCGMFSCKYADYITRGKKISFTQEDMPYFRHRMVYEIKTKKLLE